MRFEFVISSQDSFSGYRETRKRKPVDHVRACGEERSRLIVGKHGGGGGAGELEELGSA